MLFQTLRKVFTFDLFQTFPCVSCKTCSSLSLIPCSVLSFLADSLTYAKDVMCNNNANSQPKMDSFIWLRWAHRNAWIHSGNIKYQCLCSGFYLLHFLCLKNPYWTFMTVWMVRGYWEYLFVSIWQISKHALSSIFIFTLGYHGNKQFVQTKTSFYVDISVHAKLIMWNNPLKVFHML